MKNLLILGGFLCACVLGIRADSKKKLIDEDFDQIPRPELPAHAAAIVRQTPASERARVADSITERIVKQHPATAATVVSAISKAAPETSATAAAAAARTVPGHAREIEAAARDAAPGHAADINSAVNRAAKRNEHRPQNGGIGNKNGNHGNGPGNGAGHDNGNANGGVGLGPGDNKPGRGVIHDRPPKDTLPNGKPRHFPPDPPRRPVDPPRPIHYNKPHH